MLTRDDKGIALALAALFDQHGYVAEIVDTIPKNCGALIYLGSLKKSSHFFDALTINRDAFFAAKTISEKFTREGGLFVTVQDTSNELGWTSGLTGLVKTAAIEWPKAKVKSIDIQCADSVTEKIAQQLYDEIMSGDPNIEVGLSNKGRRISTLLTQQDVQDTKLTLKNDDVLVVSGGARGVSAVCLIELAKQVKFKVALLGRTQLNETPEEYRHLSASEIKKSLIQKAQAKMHNITPKEINQRVSKIMANREISDTCTKLEAQGCEVAYFSVDVTNAQQVTKVLKEVRDRFKKITGIIHAAGVLADKLISQKTQEQFDRVFTTKVEGLHNLLAATAKDKLKLMVLFSSVAARFGNQGQCDYAMANEVLNKVAQQESRLRGKSCIVKAINWGPWDGGMVSPELKALFDQNGVALIPLETGAKMFVDELKDKKKDYVEVVLGGILTNNINRMKLVDPRLKSYAVRVSASSHPCINSHIMKGTPVLPAVLGMEWFVRCAQKWYPKKKVVEIKSFDIVKGVRFYQFDGRNEEFVIYHDNQINDHPVEIELELVAKGGDVRYRAVVCLDDCLPDAPDAGELLVDLPKSPWPCSIDKIYSDEILFHGADFQVIDSLGGLSEGKGWGSLIGMSKLHWPKEKWQMDLAAIDGAMQFLLLWGYQQFQLRSIPMRIKSLKRYHHGPIEGSIRCVFDATARGRFGSNSNVYLIDEKNQLLLAMTGLEMWSILNEKKLEVV